jgi:hypothetical protein
MFTVRQLAQKVGGVNPGTLHVKLAQLRKRDPRLKPSKKIDGGIAVNFYNAEQVRLLLTHFKKNPIRKPGRPKKASPEQETA